ncbi:MAG: glycosyltransferase [Thiopseudomonas sp.]|nr:glycosyltransferase [Thiopseudomonas sp.]MCK9464760.1 glycosyltransferase [Thiopseudomonas sp.]
MKKVKYFFKYIKDYLVIKKSKLFDESYYLDNYVDVRRADIDALWHFLRLGAAEHRNPCAGFDTGYYLDSNLDVKSLGVNPLVHYIQHGHAEGRKPSAQLNNLLRVEESGLTGTLKFLAAAYRHVTKNPKVLGKFVKATLREGPQSAISKARQLVNDGYAESALLMPVGPAAIANNEQVFLAGIDKNNYRPLVTVIIPNYNHATYLPSRIESILSQGYQNLELILLDDCSTDDSRTILQDYADKRPSQIKLIFNEQNAGNVFKQWRKGLENASGELIWICESDDFCEPDFLEKLVPYFINPAVQIAFGKIQFSDKLGNFQAGLDNYREGAEPSIWHQSLVRPAKDWFCNGFGVNNLIANVGGCVFRKQQLCDEVWQAAQGYKILGDWYLYIHLAGGGLIAYEPQAVAYFRQHGDNTSVSAFSTEKYYREHFDLMRSLCTTWDIPTATIERFYAKVDAQYKHFRCQDTLGELRQYVNIDELKKTPKLGRHLLIGMLSFTPGGGELFPIHLANAICRQGVTVSLFVLKTDEINREMLELVDPQIAIYTSSFVSRYGVNKFIADAGIDAINSHMVSVDVYFHRVNKVDIPYYPTLHGSYEACNVQQSLVETIAAGVTRWIYTADRNIEAIKFLDLPGTDLIKLTNAMPQDMRDFPQTREELGLSQNTVVFTLVARGIKRKGWRAAIEAFLLLCKDYDNVHLLLCGDGDETDCYESIHGSNPKITFLGFQSHINGLYRISDCAIVPTRFAGESYPLCIIQALQEGLPVISTDVGEIRSMLTAASGKIAGRVLPNERNTSVFIQLLADAMRELMDVEIRKELSCVSMQLAKNYAMDALAQKYIELFFKKKTLYLHIGLPKTGTTAIQNFFCTNDSALKEKQKFLYPKFGRWKDGSHHQIAFSLQETDFYPWLDESAQIGYLRDLINEIENSGCDRFLLSSECFHLYNNSTFIQMFKDRYKIKIICYLRQRSEYLVSIYKQNVRDITYREKRSFIDFMETETHKLNYSNMLQPWLQMVEKEDFLIRNYAKQKLVGGAILSDFMTSLGLEIVELPTHDKKFNMSLTPVEIEYKRMINCFVDKQSPLLVQALQDYCANNENLETIDYLTSEQVHNLDISFHEDDLQLTHLFVNSNFSSATHNSKTSSNKLFDGLATKQILALTAHIKSDYPDLFDELYQSLCTASVSQADQQLYSALKNAFDALTGEI